MGVGVGVSCEVGTGVGAAVEGTPEAEVSSTKYASPLFRDGKDNDKVLFVTANVWS